MEIHEKAAPNGMSLAAFIFGILTLLGSCTIALPVFTAPLTVTFALLSRGNKRMNTQAFTGLLLAVFGLAIGLIVFVLVLLIIGGSIAALANGLLGPMMENVLNWGV